MNPKQVVCINTVLTIVIAASTVAIGYTNFATGALTEDIQDIEERTFLNVEKINSIQLTQKELNTKIDFIVEELKRIGS